MKRKLESVAESKVGEPPYVYQLISLKSSELCDFLLCNFCREMMLKPESEGHLAVLEL